MLNFKIIVFFLLVLCANQFVECAVINNRIDQYIDENGNCNLPQGLITEIQGYQPVVNIIVNAIVNGPYKGDTFKTYASLFYFLLLFYN